ncbi:MAG: TVP38/TMEM64 family protein [Christensenellaceae bacterium]|nr:TVP38/TMEM64 family protein [Christensenellaceae bacterium]
MKVNRNTIIKIAIDVGAIAIVLFLLYLALKSVLPGFVEVLAEGDQGDVQEYLRRFNDFGGYAVGFFLQFIQIITILLPSVPIQVAVGIIFGTWRGFLVCYTGYVSANAAIFFFSRKLGAGLEKLLPSRHASSKHQGMILHSEHPAFMVFLASIMPLIPNGLIPYIASKTEVKFGAFMLAVATGCIPTVLTLCAVGDQINSGDWLSAAIYVLPLFIFVGIMFWQQKNLTNLYSKGMKKIRAYMEKKRACEKTEDNEQSGGADD